MIKFRVWDKSKRRYVNNNHVTISGNLLVVAPHPAFAISQELDDPSPRFIIEQYTGLKDKNDVEIYEGDIIKRRTANYEKRVFEDEYGVVKYEKGSFYVDFRGDRDNLILRYGEPEVIGNIHENAELLKG